jgi:hypothetical protein
LQLCGRVQRVNRRAVRRRLRRRRCPGFRDAGPGEVARLRSRCGARCRWSGSSWRGAHLRVRFEPPSFLRVRAGPVARCRAASAAWLSVAGRANPGWLRAATRSQAPCGENRRGGGKPRGRNETGRLATAGRRGASRISGVDAGRCRQRGEVSGTQERMVRAAVVATRSTLQDQGAEGRSEGEVKSRRLFFDRPRSMENLPRGNPWRPTRFAGPKARRGAAKATEPLPKAVVGSEALRRDASCATSGDRPTP